MRDKTKREFEEEKIVQLIVFILGDEEFGADIAQVREIIRTRPVTPIPDSPDFIKGVINVRGEIVVTIDLKARFFLPTNEEVGCKHIVIAEQEKNLFGLMVDEVIEVLRISETDIKEPPQLVTKIHKEYVSGVITLENRLIILLDLTKVLSEEELARLTEIQRKHHAEADIESRETKDEIAGDAEAEVASTKGRSKTKSRSE